ncbi:Imm1 family immunity protein (plasmid) [Streptomyces sp. NBC_01220]|uniref:Imm1 family immunity protein n=1 Tax=Streptomyces poriferorum TaxID=2798799 RepID=A0ABY9J194_9ACTN|nr:MULTISPECIES: Imm1 family immunity protein [unclassified Streptomyces]MDP5309331.1 Imm1 family immunity protein [Streptomyces sp. Alt4]WLQ61463.1 Imm1 family immunity protein [Streptomyces sp. Alt2]WSQ49295.1 Imm1 family immunity protein [Streptomyces sp. NBC_01220]
MIVEVWIGGKMNHASDQHEVQGSIERALSELESEREVPVGFYAGTIASFHVFDVPAGEEVPEFADNSLTVGVNRATGYGGMCWWGERVPENPDQAHWVSRNETPPSFDPRVTADPGYPLWYDKRNVIPISEVASAIEEFCFNRGKRPTNVKWEPGTVNGQRLNL